MSRNSRETRVAAIIYMSRVLHHWLCTYTYQSNFWFCSFLMDIVVTYQDYKVSIGSTISPVYDFWVNLVVDKFYVPNQINLETIILKNFIFYRSNNKTIHYWAISIELQSNRSEVPNTQTHNFKYVVSCLNHP